MAMETPFDGLLVRDERDEGYFADGASVRKVKQERSSLVDDTTAMVKSEVLFHSATSTDGASRMSSIKGQTLPSLIRLRFYKSEGEVLHARRKECKRVSEQVKRRIEKEARKNCRFNRVERKEMTSGDGGPLHRVIVTRGDDKGLNIGENVKCKRCLLLRCRKMLAFDTTQGLF